MDAKRLERARSELARLRRQVANLKRDDLLGLAAAVGRVLAKRGKEGTYVSQVLPSARPISIPHHRTFNKFTARNILDALEQDIFMLEEMTEDSAS